MKLEGNSAEHRGCAASPVSSFIRVLLPGFINQLLLPRKFVESVLVDEKRLAKIAAFVNPNREAWHVDVYRSAHDEVDGQERVYVGGPGWSELAYAHGLGLGYFLVICHQGNMVFSFRAFDLSTCEITYPPIARWVAEKLSQNPKPVVARAKQEEETLATASTGENAGDGVRFEGRVTATNMLRGYVTIPARCKESSGLWKRRRVTLKDPRGRRWSVRLIRQRTRYKTEPCLMTKGWLDFARANGLKEGDRCVYEQVPHRGKGRRSVMQVTIIKSC